MKSLLRAILCLCLLAVSARADDKAEAAKLFELGKRDYNVNDFGPAIEKFKAAYKLFPDPVYLFNIAQAYRLRGTEWCALSAQFYATYQREEKDTKLRDAAKKKRDEMEACAKKHPQSKEPEPVPPANGTGAMLPPPTAPTQPPVAPPATPANPPQPEAPGPGSKKKLWGKVLMIGGGVILVVSGIGSLKAAGLTDQIRKCRRGIDPPDRCLDDNDEVDPVKVRDLESEKDASAVFAFSTGVVGAAAVIGGYLMYRAGKRADAAHNMTIVPVRNGAMAVWSF